MAAKNSSRQGGKSTDNSGPKRDKRSRRNVIVMAGLLSSLSLTSVLLLLLAPAPLAPDRTVPLISLGEEPIFKTRAPYSRHWRYIYIHHTRTPGLPETSDDHFVIGNGIGTQDGAIVMGQLWQEQQAARPAGARVSDDCITIAVVGDLDATKPTAGQLDQLERLVRRLQYDLKIGPDAVMLSDAPASPAGIGRYFPKADFGQRLR